MKKRFFKSFKLIALMAILCFAVVVTAYEIPYITVTAISGNVTDGNVTDGNVMQTTGSCGENLTYTFHNDGKLFIEGTGTMDNYELYNNINKSSAPWWNFRSSITEVVIDEGVTSIGDYAFYRCDNIKELVAPSTLKSIGNHAFSDCDNLSVLKLNEGLTTIGDYAFYDCYNIKELIIPNSVTSMGKSAFAYCNRLKSITIGSGLKEISNGAFQSVSADSVSIPLSVESIGEWAFSGNIKNVYYEGTVEQWEELKIESGNDGLKNATFHFGHAHSFTSEITT